MKNEIEAMITDIIMLSSVLFPEPDSPTIATYSPFGTEKLTFFKACTAVSPLP